MMGFFYSYLPALEKQPDFKLYTRTQIINFLFVIILSFDIFT